MAEVKVDVKVNGLSQIKKELKEVQGALLEATDPAEMNRLAEAAGKLKDRIGDAQNQIKAFSSESKLENVSNQLGQVGESLKNLDFAEAKNQAKTFATTLKSINPAELKQGFKDLTGAIGTIGKAFLQLGVTILLNPIFLLVAVIAGVVIAIVLLKDKLKIAQEAFDLLMIPINAVIDGLKELTDWLGLTAFAAEEEAERSIAANEKKIASLSKVSTAIEKEYSFQIAMAKARDEDTTTLELEREKKLKENADKQKKLYAQTLADIDKLRQADGYVEDKAITDRYNEAAKGYVAQRDLAIQHKNDMAIITQQAETDAIQKRKKDRTDRIAEEKKAAEELKQIRRTIQSLEIELMDEGVEKELAANRNKYKILREDIKANGDERAKLIKLYNELEEKERVKIDKKEAQRIHSENLKRINELIEHFNLMQRLIDTHNELVTRADETAEQKAIKDKEAFYDNAEAAEEKFRADIKLNAALAGRELSEQEEAEITASNDRQIQLEAKKITTIQKMRKDFADTAEVNAEKESDRRQQAAADFFGGMRAVYEKEIQEFANTFSMWTDLASGLSNALNDLFNQQDENRLTDIENATNAQMLLLDERKEKELANANLTASQKNAIEMKYAKQKYQIELEAFKKEEEIKKKQFARDKSFRLINAVLDTASAVVQTFANTGGYPTGIVPAAIMAAIGAVQIGVIASQKYQGETGPSAPSTTSGGFGGGGGSEPSNPNFDTNRTNTGSAGGPSLSVGEQTILVTAVVSETELTATQNKVKKIEQSAQI